MKTDIKLDGWNVRRVLTPLGTISSWVARSNEPGLDGFFNERLIGATLFASSSPKSKHDPIWKMPDLDEETAYLKQELGIK